jgi:hypothetical protein
MVIGWKDVVSNQVVIIQKRRAMLFPIFRDKNMDTDAKELINCDFNGSLNESTPLGAVLQKSSF